MTTWIIAVPESDTVQYIRSPHVAHPMAIKQEHMHVTSKVPETVEGDLADRPCYDAQRWDVV